MSDITLYLEQIEDLLNERTTLLSAVETLADAYNAENALSRTLTRSVAAYKANATRRKNMASALLEGSVGA